MGNFTSPTSAPGTGMFPDARPFSCTNATGAAVAKGDIVVFDILDSLSSSPTPSFTPGTGSVWDMAREVTTAMLTDIGAVFGVVTVGGASLATIHVATNGVHTVNASGGTVNAGDELTGVNASQSVADAATGNRVLALALEDEASSLALAYFDGWNRVLAL